MTRLEDADADANEEERERVHCMRRRRAIEEDMAACGKRQSAIEHDVEPSVLSAVPNFCHRMSLMDSYVMCVYQPMGDRLFVVRTLCG